jgi:hypothetical protein
MLAYSINRQSLTLIRQAYRGQQKSMPQQIGRALRSLQSAVEVFKKAAEVYSAARGNPSAFVCFQHDSLSIQVMSASGELGRFDFHSDTPGTLMGKVVTERLSVHVPGFRKLDRRSLEQRRIDSGDAEVFSRQQKEVELVGDDGKVQKESHFSSQIIAVLPMDFTPESGSVLLTPLGIERSTPFAFGFIWEYQRERPFALPAIQEARTISAQFTYHIVKRLVRELGA